jgi:aminoglycoside 2'-N-acetyltransferase I
MAAIEVTRSPGDGVLAAAHALMLDVFGSEFREDDWPHALGGLHALAWDGDVLVGHASVVARELFHSERALRTGYVEAVAVAASHRRQGVGSGLMEGIETEIRDNFDLGALSTTELAMPLYESHGWRRWRGPTYVAAPDGWRRTPDDDGGIYVLPVGTELDLDGPIACDWRSGEVW